MMFSLAILVLELLDLLLQDVELLLDLLLTPLIIGTSASLRPLAVARQILVLKRWIVTLLGREEEVPHPAARILRSRGRLELRETGPVLGSRGLVAIGRDGGGEVVSHHLAMLLGSPRSGRTSGGFGTFRPSFEKATPGGGSLHRSLCSFTGEARFHLPCLDDVERLR